MIIWAFDPGKTTGYCCLKAPDNKIPTLRVLALGETTDLYKKDFLLSGLPGARFVVIERAFNSGPAFNPVPFEAIGVIKMVCSILEIPVYMQEPSRTRFIQKRYPHITTTALGLPGSLPHATDALRHALFILYSTYRIQKFLLKNGKHLLGSGQLDS